MPESTRLRIGVVEKNRGAYWASVNAGWHDAADRLGLELDIRAPEYEDVDDQVRLLEEFLADGVDGLAFVGTADGVFDDVARRARDQGVAVVTFDLDSAIDHRSVFVGMEDPETIGRRLGLHIAERLRRGDLVALQAGSARARGAVGKLRGLQAAFAEAGIRTVVSEPDGEDLNLAATTSWTLLSDNPDAAAAVGVYGYHPETLAGAKRATGSNARIFGFDLLDPTIDLLRAGEVEASVWIREYEFGFLAAAALHDLIRLGDSVLALYGGAHVGAGIAFELEPRVMTGADFGDHCASRPGFHPHSTTNK